MKMFTAPKAAHIIHNKYTNLLPTSSSLSYRKIRNIRKSLKISQASDILEAQPSAILHGYF